MVIALEEFKHLEGKKVKVRFLLECKLLGNLKNLNLDRGGIGRWIGSNTRSVEDSFGKIRFKISLIKKVT